MIYHILPTSEWNKWRNAEHYEHASLKEEGFIHCSTAEQVEGVVDRYFKGVEDLVFLHIDPNLLEAELKYEESTGGELYPHIYGTINRKAIVKTEFEFEI